MRRKATLLIAAMLVAVVAVGGIALAETLDGGPGDNRLIGSNGRDQIDGNGGEDFIKGLRSRDTLNGGSGKDTIIAGPRHESAVDTVFGGDGDDVIRVRNRPAAKDVVDCGAGNDRVRSDSKDVLSRC
jgi:hypothetical protein